MTVPRGVIMLSWPTTPTGPADDSGVRLLDSIVSFEPDRLVALSRGVAVGRQSMGVLSADPTEVDVRSTPGDPSLTTALVGLGIAEPEPASRGS